MASQLVIRRSRRQRRAPVALGALRAAMANAGALALANRSAAQPAPSLRLSEPGDRRDAWRAGAIAGLLHLSALVALVVAAMLAPEEVIERIFPVSIVRDAPPPPSVLPGSNEKPAPAGPKAVGAARASAADLAAARGLTAEEAEALRQAALEAARRDALQSAALDAAQPNVAPAQVERREVAAKNVVAQAATVVAPAAAAVDLSPAPAPRIDPAEIEALRRDSEGPRRIDAAAPVALSAPEAFSALAELGGEPQAAGGVAVSGAALGDLGGRGQGSGGVDTGIAAVWSGSGGGGSGSGPGGPGSGASGDVGGGGGAGGDGHASGVVPCLQSAGVQRYLDGVRERTRKRWSVPAGTKPDSQVILRFDLDAAGMASRVEVEEGEDAVLGKSAVRALIAAAPFPPMDDATRCLTEKRIKTTFSIPSP
jgi:hypothetical protein